MELNKLAFICSTLIFAPLHAGDITIHDVVVPSYFDLDQPNDYADILDNLHEARQLLNPNGLNPNGIAFGIPIGNGSYGTIYPILGTKCVAKISFDVHLNELDALNTSATLISEANPQAINFCLPLLLVQLYDGNRKLSVNIQVYPKIKACQKFLNVIRQAIYINEQKAINLIELFGQRVAEYQTEEAVLKRGGLGKSDKTMAHRDMNYNNVMVTKTSDGQFKFNFIDLGTMVQKASLALDPVYFIYFCSIEAISSSSGNEKIKKSFKTFLNGFYKGYVNGLPIDVSMKLRDTVFSNESYHNGKGPLKFASKGSYFVFKNTKECLSTKGKDYSDIIDWLQIEAFSEAFNDRYLTIIPGFASDLVQLMTPMNGEATRNLSNYHYDLGVEFVYGTNVNPDAAVYYLTRSANYDNRDAQYLLGLLYTMGFGTRTQDYVVAAKLFEKAANLNHTDASYNLGILLEMGQGVAQNLNEAYFHYHKAAMGGNIPAQYRKGCMILQGLSDIKDMNKGVDCIQEAANAGLPQAQYHLAQIYMQEQNDEKQQLAQELIMKAADQGHIDAQVQIAQAYVQSQQDPEQQRFGLDVLLQAASMGHRDAQFYAGQFYENGYGVVQNLLTAFEYYQNATLNGHTEAGNKFIELGTRLLEQEDVTMS